MHFTGLHGKSILVTFWNSHFLSGNHHWDATGSVVEHLPNTGETLFLIHRSRWKIEGRREWWCSGKYSKSHQKWAGWELFLILSDLSSWKVIQRKGGRKGVLGMKSQSAPRTHLNWHQTNHFICLHMSSELNEQGEVPSLLVHSLGAEGSWPVITKGSKRWPMAQRLGLESHDPCWILCSGAIGLASFLVQVHSREQKKSGVLLISEVKRGCSGSAMNMGDLSCAIIIASST